MPWHAGQEMFPGYPGIHCEEVIDGLEERE